MAKLASKLTSRLASRLASKTAAGTTCQVTPASKWAWVVSLALALTLLTVVVVHVLRAAWGGSLELFSQRQPETRSAKSTRYHVVFLHMDGCGHCETFKPVWAQFRAKHGDELQARGIALVDMERATWSKWLSDHGVAPIDVRGFPTVLLIDEATHAEKSRFEEDRTVDALHHWVLQASA